MSTARKRNAANVDSDTRGKDIANENTIQTQPSKSSRGTTIPSPAAIATTVFPPTLITTLLLIFGGCCSNVYTLESILSLSPASGSLVTFLQFLLTALFTLPSQITFKNSDSSSGIFPRLTNRRIPLTKWIIYTALFLIPNFLNNYAFKYRIGIPLHIIIRSAGPVTSMLVGYLSMGRTYPLRKILAVLILFSGVVTAALSDASAKGNTIALSSSTAPSATASELSRQFPGFAVLFLALVVSAFLGIYTDEIYKEHGCDDKVTNENLFYSHLLSIPFFAAQYRGLYSQYLVMQSMASDTPLSPFAQKSTNLPSFLKPLAPYLPAGDLAQNPIVLLFANALTQIICITGVNRLATQTTSLTVSIVLNVRKLVSLLLSIWLFGNQLPPGVTVGAILVFFGVGLYTYPVKRKQE